MHPHLLRWIADTGLGLVAPDLYVVDDVDTVPIRDLVCTASIHSQLASSSAPEIAGCADRLAAAWSAPAPARHLRAVADGARSLGAEVLTVIRRLDAALGTVEVAQRTLGADIERANRAVDWNVGYVAWGTPEAAARTGVAGELAAAVRTAREQVVGAISGLTGLLATDPGAALAALMPAAGAPGVPPGFAPRTLDGSAAALDGRTRARLMADLRCGTPWQREFAGRTLDALAAAEAAGGRAQLLVYDPDAFAGQGRVAISVGDVSGADHVAVLTPGIANSPASVVDSVPAAAAIRNAAQQEAPGESTAVVLWFGYDIPLSGAPNDTTWPGTVADATSAASAANALAGAPLLVHDVGVLNGLVRPAATVTLIGHSMGSLLTAEAARSPLDLDAVVLIGSPGVGHPQARVEDMRGVAPQDVFVLSSDRDPVTSPWADLGAQLTNALVHGAANPPYGTDPAAVEFGAQRIDVPAPLIDSPLLPTTLSMTQHPLGAYLTGTGLMAVGAVVAGRSSRVRRGRGR